MANARALDDEIEVAKFLKKLVAALGMRVRAGPLCGRNGGAPEKNGISGAVILYESHAAIHTYSQLRAAFLDIFSCVPSGAANRPSASMKALSSGRSSPS